VPRDSIPQAASQRNRAAEVADSEYQRPWVFTKPLGYAPHIVRIVLTIRIHREHSGNPWTTHESEPDRSLQGCALAQVHSVS
jgi:hypothetical protein